MPARVQFDPEIVFAACARFDTAVEINCRPERQDPPDELLELALEWDCKVSIDTDAHAPGQLEWQPYGCDKAARHEIEPGPIVNTWPADDSSNGPGRTRPGSVVRAMSKKTKKRKINARRKKANHGRKPNAGGAWLAASTLTGPPAAGLGATTSSTSSTASRCADPFRWLEDGDDRRDPGVGRRPERPHPRRRSTPCPAGAGCTPGCCAAPRRLVGGLRRSSGDRVFSLERWGHHDQAVLVVRSRAATAGDPARSLVDPVALTGDPTAAIDWYHPSPDGRLVAYGCRPRATSARPCTSSTCALGAAPARRRSRHPRGVGGVGCPTAPPSPTPRYPDGASDDALLAQGLLAPARHRPWPDDPLVWDDLPDKTAWPNVSLSRDGRWLLVHVSLGWSRVDVHLIDRAPGRRDRDDRGHRGGVLVVRRRGRPGSSASPRSTPTGAGSCPRRSSAAWHDNWCTIVPESDAVLEAPGCHGDSLRRAASTSAVVAPRPLRRTTAPADEPSTCPSSARWPG